MVSDSTAPDSLVNRVSHALGAMSGYGVGFDTQARVTLHEVAAWLRKNDSNYQMGGDAAVTADLLDAEANRFANG